MSKSKPLKNVSPGVAWRRCQVHFMRNVFDKLPKNSTQVVRNALKVLFKATNLEVARIMKTNLTDKYSESYPNMTDCLDAGFEDAFQYCTIEETPYSRIKSTNLLDRLNEEIRHREKVIRLFLNVQSILRLIGVILIDNHEDWTGSSRHYVSYTEAKENRLIRSIY